MFNKTYYPYKSDKPDKKFFIITSSGKKVYFGQASASDFTIHKDEDRKLRYIKRHEKNENWNKSGIDTSGFWSRWYLWNLPTLKGSYEDIKKRFLN
jgi:predicted peptidase